MSLDTKVVLKYLGFDETIDSEDAFKAEFDKTFVRGSNIGADSQFVKPILGRVFGEQENELKKIAKAYELDIDFDSDEFKGHGKITEKAKFILGKVDEKRNASIKELQTKLASGSDENLKSLETKLEKLKKEKAETEGLLNDTKTQFEQFKTQSAMELKNVKISTLTGAAKQKIKFRPDLSDIERKGFVATIAEKYNLDLSEDGQLIPLTKTGERIKSATVTGAFKTYEEVLNDEAGAAKLLQLNQDGGKPAPAGVPAPGSGAPAPASSGPPVRKAAEPME